MLPEMTLCMFKHCSCPDMLQFAPSQVNYNAHSACDNASFCTRSALPEHVSAKHIRLDGSAWRSGGVPQVGLAVRCLQSILGGGAHISPLATASLLGCFDIGRMVPLMQLQDADASDHREV